jgi:hypothetical protein
MADRVRLVRMGFFGPSRAERLEAAAHVLRGAGFAVEPARANALCTYAPFVLLPTPTAYVTSARGEIEGRLVELFEYESTSTESDGSSSQNTELVVVAHHRNIRGGACFAPDWPKWGGVAAFIDAIFWLPPFILLKAVQLAVRVANPKRTVGHEAFDHLFVARADSDEAARAAIPRALCDVVSGELLKVTVELRAGVMVFAPHGLILRDESVARILDVTDALLDVFDAR